VRLLLESALALHGEFGGHFDGNGLPLSTGVVGEKVEIHVPNFASKVDILQKVWWSSLWAHAGRRLIPRVRVT